MSGHSKLPWYVGAQNDMLYIIDKPPRPVPTDYPADIPDLKVIAKIMAVGEFATESANASLIVRSVNAHSKLVELLERALPFIDDAADAHSVMSETCLAKECLQVVADIKAALASAKGMTE
jgi:hypothetical protein